MHIEIIIEDSSGEQLLKCLLPRILGAQGEPHTWPLPGQLKHEWAEKIGPEMDIENNASLSFCKLRDGLRRLIGETA